MAITIIMLTIALKVGNTTDKMYDDNQDNIEFHDNNDDSEFSYLLNINHTSLVSKQLK